MPSIPPSFSCHIPMLVTIHGKGLAYQPVSLWDLEGKWSTQGESHMVMRRICEFHTDNPGDQDRTWVIRNQRNQHYLL